MAETTETTGTDLLAPDVLTPESLFNAADGAAKGAQLIERIAKLAADFKPDLSTPKGRGEISSLAFRITRTKTAIDAAGKKVNEDARAQINAVDAQRRDYWAKLEELAKTVRKPLTEWEEAEEARVNVAKAVVEELKQLGIVLAGTTSQEVARRVLHLRALEPDEAVLQEYFQQATAAKAESLKALAAVHKRLLQEEADRAELDKLRKEAADRKAADDAKAEEEAAAAEAKRKAEEEAEAETRRLAEVAAAEQRGRDAAAAAATEAERKRLDDEAARAADKAHRREVIEKAAVGILNVTGMSAKKSVLLAEAIAEGQIPSVKMEF